MFNKRVVLMYTLAVVLVAVGLLGKTVADPSHPQRPEKFTSEEQLRKYLRELKQYYEDNVRIGRFGKRNYFAPAMIRPKPYPKHNEPEWKNGYDYDTQFNI